MSNIDKQALREAAEKAIAAITRLNYEPGSNPDDVKIINEFHEMVHPECVLALLDELEVVNELFLRAKALMYQSGGTPIENSLNPIDAWLYDAERAAAAGKGE